MDPRAQDVWQGILEQGERLLWSGRQHVSPWRVAGVAVMAPVMGFCSLVFLTLPIALWLGAAADGGQILAHLSILTVLWGLVFLDAATVRASYGVTDRRVMIVHGRQRASAPLQGLFDISLKMRSGGRGDINFPSWVVTPSRWVQAYPAAFVRIDGARQVYDLIQERVRASRT